MRVFSLPFDYNDVTVAKGYVTRFCFRIQALSPSTFHVMIHIRLHELTPEHELLAMDDENVALLVDVTTSASVIILSKKMLMTTRRYGHIAACLT